MKAKGQAMDPGCLRCCAGDYGRQPRPDGLKHTQVGSLPSMAEIEAWVLDSVCEATDGCRVEPDGYCPDGHPSWLLVLGLV